MNGEADMSTVRLEALNFGAGRKVLMLELIQPNIVITVASNVSEIEAFGMVALAFVKNGTSGGG